MIQQKHELKLKCAVALLLVTAGMAHALTDRYWTGGASIVWKDTGNWASLATARIPDTTGERAVFSGTIVRHPQVNTGANGYSIAQLKFLSAGWTLGSQYSGYFLVIAGDDGVGTLGVWDNAAGQNTIACNLMLAGNHGNPLEWRVISGGTLTMAKTISSSGSGLLKTGAGTLILSAINSYGGTTRIDQGTLLVNGALDYASAVTVAFGKLGGTGMAQGPVTVKASGTLSPGDPSVNSGVGTLAGGATVLESGATFSAQIKGTSCDFYNSSGTVTLAPGAKLSLSVLDDQIRTDTDYTILSAGLGLTGTFDGIPNGGQVIAGGVRFKVTYTATQVRLRAFLNGPVFELK